MVPLDRALVSSYRLSIVTMLLTAAVWLQFATQVFRGGIGRLTCIGSYVNKQVTTFTFRAPATTCSKHHTRTVMDAGCECAPWVRSANPSDSSALVLRVLRHRWRWWQPCSARALCPPKPWWVVLGSRYPSTMHTNYPDTSVCDRASLSSPLSFKSSPNLLSSKIASWMLTK